MRIAVVLAVLSLAGCAAHKSYARLDAESKDDLRVCHDSIAQSQCGIYGADLLARNLSCVNPLIEQYEATPKAARKTWLLRHGCPRDMVDPTDSLRQPEAKTPIIPRARESHLAKEWEGFTPAGELAQ